MTPDQILQALGENGHSYASIGRSLDPPVTRQSVHDVVVYGKSSSRIMTAVAIAIDIPPATVFPQKAHLFEKKDTGKPSHRSTVNGESVQTSGHPSKARSQSKSKDKARGDACSTPEQSGPKGEEMAA